MKKTMFALFALSCSVCAAESIPDTDKVLAYIRKAFPQTIRQCPRDQGDQLGVPQPFTSPCAKGGFNQLFYWDTYFMNVGLLRIGMRQQAQNNADDLLFLADKLGCVPNANCRSMTNRSQPPLLALMVRDMYSATGDKEWLKGAYAALAKEYEFWMTKRMTPLGLNRYGNSASEKDLMGFYGYLSGMRFKGVALPSRPEKIAFASNALSEAESGWDFTPRFQRRCNDFCPVDLNAFLYMDETILADLSRVLGNGAEKEWRGKAECRKKLMQEFLWNNALSCYTDYDYVNKREGDVVSCATLLPLVAGIATKRQAARVVSKMKTFLEYDHGLAACEKLTWPFAYQWDYPNGWPPLQAFAIQALDRYGFKDDARRIAEKYVRTVIRNFETTGTLWEKYNVVSGTTRVTNEYAMPEMVGWTAGVFVFAAEYLVSVPVKEACATQLQR